MVKPDREMKELLFEKIMGLGDGVNDRLDRIFRNTSFETILMVNLIVMLLFAVTCTGFVMGKDAEMNIGYRASDRLTELAGPVDEFFDTGYATALEMMKLDRAPNVIGFKEKKAVTKLKKENVDPERIEVKHEKVTYTALVENSDTLFFGEVEKQRVTSEGIILEILTADTNDPFTVQMNAMGSRLAWPVPGHERLSSHFGHRSSPGGIGSTNHQGIDIPAPTGRQIIAVKEGTVESAGRSGGYGNCVIIDHHNGFKSLYGHMSRITCNAGDKVKPGDVIGKVGSTGWSTGAHLHFGLSKDGQFIDPEPFFTGKENLQAGDEVSENDSGTDQTDASTSSENESTSSTKKDSKEKKETTKSTTKKKEQTRSTTKPVENTTKATPTKEETTKPEPTHEEPTTSGGDTGNGEGGQTP